MNNKPKSFSMSILLDIKDSASLDNKWLKTIIKHKCSMAIFSVVRTMNLKKKIPISRFLKKDPNFQIIMILIILKRKESPREKIMKKIKLKLKLQIKICLVKINNVSYSLFNKYI